MVKAWKSQSVQNTEPQGASSKKTNKFLDLTLGICPSDQPSDWLLQYLEKIAIYTQVFNAHIHFGGSGTKC